MKTSYPRIGLAGLCGWFGITRQAYYNYNRDRADEAVGEELILQEVLRIRKDHPRMGTRKLYGILRPFLSSHGIKLGRDGLFNLLSDNHLLVRRRRRGTRTTFSSHWLHKYPNLIRALVPTGPEQLWVSDITYWTIGKGRHLYISLVTDAYSRKIVGHQVSDTLAAEGSVQALQMAIASLSKRPTLQLIHHSDRGLQYCSQSYVKLLEGCNIRISMTEHGDPLENAVAERMNGILKGEYLEHYKVNNLKDARELLDEKVRLYNTGRPHMSISNHHPDAVHRSERPMDIQRLWKNYYRKKPEPVNLGQDLGPTVNQYQDYHL
jgi:transposase InsO family protein